MPDKHKLKKNRTLFVAGASVASIRALAVRPGSSEQPLRPRVGSPKAVDASPGLWPPSPQGEGQGGEGTAVNKLDQSLNLVATK